MGEGVAVGGVFYTLSLQEPFGPLTSPLEMVAGSTIRMASLRRAELVGGGGSRGSSGSQWIAPRRGCMCKQSHGVALLHILVECISSPSMVENARHTPHASKYLLGPLSKYRKSF